MGLFSRVSTLRREPHGQRIIHLNDPIKNQQQKFLHNRISTAKYNAVTFLPKFLYEQFTKYANMFFLFVSCIQQIPNISPTNKAGTAIPLSIVIIFSAIKEIFEDVKRRRQDTEVNNRMSWALQGQHFVKKSWSDIQVGDIVRIENSEFFPADIILLSSSEPDGICYIETSNLDGETNLKIRQALPETAHMISPPEIARFEGLIRSELPNNRLYTYEGTLSTAQGDLPLNPTQILLRGAQLRNTPWIYAVVVFTGHETKLMRNATATPIKKTKVDGLVNTQIIFLFCILIVMSVICSGAMFVRTRSANFESRILLFDTTLIGSLNVFGGNILTFIILFNNLIPLSLIVTMEVVKLMLSALINQDLDMFYEPSNTPATARTSSLVEELGQIDYIFSDKTGTLTCNIMEFRMCSVAGVVYADVVPDDKKSRDDGGTSYKNFLQLNNDLKEGPNSAFLNEFLTLLAVCHTVIPERSDTEPGGIVYQASSPDEAALVKGARSLGYEFVTRRPRSVTIVAKGQELEFEILNICEFNSTRKRMSAIVRGPDGRIKLLTKGADTVILERLAPNNPFVDITTIHLEECACEGLRTLCIAYREVSEAEYSEWSSIYDRAATTITNRQEELDRAAELIEKDLFLIGATAIEDKLQDGVPDTIHTLMEAGIKIWVLTGDRQETAINIGYSCKLITEEMQLIVCNEETHFDTKQYLQKKLEMIRGPNPSPGFENVRHYTNPSGYQKLMSTLGVKRGIKMRKDIDTILEPLALIIDGRTLDFALEKDIEMLFLELATLCKAVICCRVSPLQKALVVKLVKRNVEGSVTLAIGDGANDVSMIQSAHVGIGISGMEGLQAARAADFAIAQFRFLRKLLLVHGGWAYSRLSKLILYSFYKNITMYTIQLWFAIDNGFSGQTLFESWTQASYNVAFAVLQPLVLGVFDCYVSARMLDKYPQIYKLGQRSEFYNHRTFWAWIINSFFHSLVLYWMMSCIYGEGNLLGSGLMGNLWLLGQSVYTVDLLTITWKAAIITDTWVSYTYIAYLGSIGLWFTGFPLWSLVGPLIGISDELTGLAAPMFGNASLWFSILVVPIAAVLRDFVWRYVRRTYFPKSYHIIQEIQKFNVPDYRPRQEWFRKAVHKVRQIQRLQRTRGFAFSQNESGQANLIRVYDTTRRKPTGM
ncbi:uncharacterized protein BJ171DRAFT_221525 [Polychytrium aggregatum]|uniref:uncharacterized protein n=1 Tax=Polychytrium aggregatum TaxID=110093 RepID=UPI0022FF0A68|nr:uncharacterized protein BJ171DRAFT_221525 [Polychytrium aggregatum]KAI9197490.1 hypothetical protein BJ171DRAFT_221525 [Polychytrium aggregatum]